MSYWDSSALVKLFAAETDSPSFHAHVRHQGDRLATSELTRMELWSAFRRKESEGEIGCGEARVLLSDFDAGAVQDYWIFVIVTDAIRAEFERVVERCCSQTPPVFIRTLDALHIASARAAGETEIVATDKRLCEAAMLLGFQLFPAPTP